MKSRDETKMYVTVQCHKCGADIHQKDYYDIQPCEACGNKTGAWIPPEERGIALKVTQKDSVVLNHKLSNLTAELIGVHNGMLIIINQGCIEEASPEFWELPRAENEVMT